MDNSTMSTFVQVREVGNGTEGNESLDHNLYSRQIYALGESAMKMLRGSSVLVSGMSGCGVEIAKNLIIGGVGHVAIHDTKITKWNDLSSQYFLRENDIGSNRAEACFERLSELNDSVQCSLHVQPLCQEYVMRFDLVVLVECPRSTQLVIAAWTRPSGKRLVVADARGLFSYVFVDFGSTFRVDDDNGEPCKEFLVEGVSRDTGDVFVINGLRSTLKDGDYVAFSEVKGMTELNDIEHLKITVKNADNFNIGDITKDFKPYEEGGRCRQVKLPFTVSHKPLAESLRNPDFSTYDPMQPGRPSKLLALWTALYAFEERHRRSPRPRNVEDRRLLKAELPEASNMDEKLLEMFSNSEGSRSEKVPAFEASGNLVAVCSVAGGIAAQEVMKGLTHHLTPLNQWLYMDAVEAVPGDWTALNNALLNEADCAPRNSRYDGQAAVFGWKYQEALFSQREDLLRWFVVGSGAIGCELLKNMAMMGVACGEKGCIKITDMDHIEISNLNRQFLFRRTDVGKKKSETAARAIRAFNKNVNIECLAERVGPETEHIFDDDFFASLHGVANALDNVEARRYVDRRVVYYRLPLLESGTMGTKGTTQTIYPHLTENYSSAASSSEKAIPICTLKSFPNQIHHTIQWARELFEGVFTEAAETANKFLRDREGFHSGIRHMHRVQQVEKLTAVKRALVDERPQTAQHCIEWARRLFQENHHDIIAQLLHSFPHDHLTERGTKFWSGSKICPHVLHFDATQATHFDLIYAASILRAQQYGIDPILDRNEVARIASNVAVEPFTAKDGARIAVSDEELAESGDEQDDEDEAVFDELRRTLATVPLSTSWLHPIDFEKDDDTNHHLEFVAAASNLRAENYNIPRVDRMKTKQIAGRIVPALATTTAVVAGLVCIELHKTVMLDSEGGRAVIPISRFKRAFYNLATCFYMFVQPAPAPKKKYKDVEFTMWDQIKLRGPLTLGQLLETVERKCGVTVEMVATGPLLIDVTSAREATEVKCVIEEVMEKPLPSYLRSIAIEVEATVQGTSDEVEIPIIKYELPAL